MKFTVTERYTKSYEIEADSFEDAREKAIEGEDMSELDSGDFASIMDALGVWHEAVKYALKKYAIPAI